MAMAALPLAEMAGAAVAPGLEEMVGKEMYGKLAPLAKAGLSKVVKSKAVKKIGHKIGNKLFGKHKHARKLMKAASGKGPQKMLKSGLDIGQNLGLVSSEKADNIKGGYEKALSMHDRLSNFNQPKDKASVQEVEMEPSMVTPQQMGAAADMVVKGAPSEVIMGHAISKDNLTEKEKKLGDILELMGVKF